MSTLEAEVRPAAWDRAVFIGMHPADEPDPMSEPDFDTMFS